MYIDRVTIAGVDDNVDRNELYKLSDQYPFVQWGVLLYKEKQGKPRYPSNEWIDKFDRYAPEFVSRNVHLCGSNAYDFCTGDLSVVRYSAYGHPRYDSIQVNLPSGLRISGRERHIADLFVRSSKVITTIIQANEYSMPIVNTLHTIEDGNFVNILFDESRGKGVEGKFEETKEMHTLLRKSTCGFAGGVNPDNIVKISDKIQRISNHHYDIKSILSREKKSPPNTWIDMESGVRTDNEFDLDKVRLVLEKMSKFMRGM